MNKVLAKNVLLVVADVMVTSSNAHIVLMAIMKLAWMQIVFQFAKNVLETVRNAMKTANAQNALIMGRMRRM